MDNTEGIRLPRYGEIPGVGLYLEQVTKYIGECLAPLGEEVTGSMISNYVKRGLVANPVKKQYGRGQIAALIAIAALKRVLSMEEIRLLLPIACSDGEAYDGFCARFEGALACRLGQDGPAEELALAGAIAAAAQRAELDGMFAALRQEDGDEGGSARKGGRK